MLKIFFFIFVLVSFLKMADNWYRFALGGDSPANPIYNIVSKTSDTVNLIGDTIDTMQKTVYSVKPVGNISTKFSIKTGQQTNPNLDYTNPNVPIPPNWNGGPFNPNNPQTFNVQEFELQVPQLALNCTNCTGSITTDTASNTQTININVPASASSVATLTDASITNVANNQILQYDATTSKWTNKAVSAAGASSISTLTDATITSVADNQVLQYEAASSQWKNKTLTPAVSNLTDATITAPATDQSFVYDSTASKWVNKNIIFDKTAITTCTSNTTLADWNQTVLADASSGNVTITLPTIDTASLGKKIEVKRTDNNTSNLVKIIPAATNKIDSSLTAERLLPSQHDSICFRSNGSTGDCTVTAESIKSMFLTLVGTSASSITNFSLLLWNKNILVNATTGGVSITLPSANSLSTMNGFLEFKRTDNTTNSVRIIPFGSELIDNDAGNSNGVFLFSKGDSIVVKSNGAGVVYMTRDNRNIAAENKSFLRAEQRGKTTPVGGANIVCNTITSQSGTNIQYDSNTGIVTLRPGHTYRLTGTPGYIEQTTGQQMNVSGGWRNLTNNTFIGSSFQYYIYQASVAQISAECTITPTVETQMAIRFTGISPASSITYSDTHSTGNVSRLANIYVEQLTSMQNVISFIDVGYYTWSTNEAITLGNSDLNGFALVEGNMSVSTAPKSIILYAGKQYSISMTLCATFSATNHNAIVRIVNAATNIQLAQATSLSWNVVQVLNQTATASCVITPIVNTSIKFRVASITGTMTIQAGYSFINIQQLGTSATIAPTMFVATLTDASITSVADNQVLQYEAASSKWKNKTLLKNFLRGEQRGLATISLNEYMKCNTITHSSGTNIQLNFGTTDGTVTLLAGQTYKLTGCLGQIVPVADYNVVVCWYNKTNFTFVGTALNHIASLNYDSTSTAECIITTTVTTHMALRCSFSNHANVQYSENISGWKRYAYIYVEQLS